MKGEEVCYISHSKLKLKVLKESEVLMFDTHFLIVFKVLWLVIQKQNVTYKLYLCAMHTGCVLRRYMKLIIFSVDVSMCVKKVFSL